MTSRTGYVGRCRREGGRIEPSAGRALADAHGSNLWALMGEIEKLLLYVGPDRPVSEADVAVMAGSTREENIFAMVDDVIERRYPRARERLERLRLRHGRGHAPDICNDRDSGQTAARRQGQHSAAGIAIRAGRRHWNQIGLCYPQDSRSKPRFFNEPPQGDAPQHPGL